MSMIMKLMGHILSEQSIFTTSIIFLSLHNHYQYVPFLKRQEMEGWNSVTSTWNCSQTHVYKLSFLKEICILLIVLLQNESQNSIKHTSWKQEHKWKFLTGIHANKIMMLNLHLIFCCTYWVSALATAVLHIHNDKTMKWICFFFLYQQKSK